MKRSLALVLAVAVAAVVASSIGPGGAQATTSGPNIELGTPVGTTVTVLATTTATTAYSGFNVHLVTKRSAGVTFSTSISAAGSILGQPNELFCGSAIPAGLPDDRTAGCTHLGGAGITSSGLLLTFSFSSTGNGCILVSLRTDISAVLGTYTIDASDITPQSNVVDTTSERAIIVGAGTSADCPGAATPTLTDTPTPPPPTPTPQVVGAPHLQLGDAVPISPRRVRVPVELTIGSIPPFMAFNVHIAVYPSNGVHIREIAGSSQGSAMADGPLVCDTTVVSPTERMFNCAELRFPATLVSGPLASFILSARGNGCVDVSLVTDTHDRRYDTYTDNGYYTAGPQTIVNTTRLSHALIGSGTLADYPGAAAASPTATNTPVGVLSPTPTAPAGQSVGPHIALGVPVTIPGLPGAALPVRALTDAPNPFDGFQIAIAVQASAGIAFPRDPAPTIDGSGSLLRGTLLPALDCQSKIGQTGESIALCQNLYVLAHEPGLLTTLVFNALGDGCITTALLPQPISDISFGTFTLRQPTGSQRNWVDPSPRYILIGHGTFADCPARPTQTQSPSPTGTPPATAIASRCAGVAGDDRAAHRRRTDQGDCERTSRGN